MNHTTDAGEYAYGFWGAVIFNSLLFIVFAFSFARPKDARDWRSFGAFSAFIVALFTEMYGIPLTIYVLAPWLQKAYPGLNIFGHDSGHLWYVIFGLKGDPHSGLWHIISNLLMVGGFWIIAAAWRQLYVFQKKGMLATEGWYARMRHPQYLGFVLVLLGFLVQWPTLLTLIMFPFLAWRYAHLAKIEEKEIEVQFGDEYRRWAKVTPAFFPRLSMGDGKNIKEGRS